MLRLLFFVIIVTAVAATIAYFVGKKRRQNQDQDDDQGTTTSNAANSNPGRIAEIRSAANVLIESSGYAKYWQDEFIDVHIQGKNNPNKITKTIVEIKPVRGSSQRDIVFMYNNRTKRVETYIPQDPDPEYNFWEDHLFAVADEARGLKHDIKKSDPRRKALDMKLEIERLRNQQSVQAPEEPDPAA